MNEENSSQLIKSGNPLVDLTWGGFYKGGTYFVIGPPKSGKTILALQFALNASSKADSCLYLRCPSPAGSGPAQYPNDLYRLRDDSLRTQLDYAGR